MRLYTLCDGEKFNQHAYTFIASLNRYSPGQSLHIHIINPLSTITNQISILKKQTRALTLSFSFSTIKNSSKLSAHFKINLINQLKHAFCDLLYINIELIIKQSLLALFSHLHSMSIALSLKESDAMLPDVLWLRPKQKVIKSIEKWYSGPLSYFLSSFSSLQPMILNNRFLETFFDDKPSKKLKCRLTHHFLKQKSILIVSRRIDLPFDKKIIPTRKRALQNITTQTRLYWESFPLLLQEAYLKNDMPVELYCKPNASITQKWVDSLPHDVIYLPHKNHKQIKDKRVRFYMQEIYPYFFTIDTQGWGGTHSLRQSTHYLNVKNTENAKQFIENIKRQKETKYKQITTTLPNFDIFFPLQVPNDDALKFGAPHSLKKIVRAVIHWAKNKKVRILFKIHPKAKYTIPISLFSFSPYIKVIKNGNIHDILSKATCVFTVNSGVGFEALLYQKPLVTFGNSSYESLSVPSILTDISIQAAYEKAVLSPIKSETYLKWLEWYLFNVGYLMNLTKVTLPLHDRSSITMPLPLRTTETLSLKKQKTKQRTFKSCLLFSHPIKHVLYSLLSIWRYKKSISTQ
jgi:hypothetical protein